MRDDTFYAPFIHRIYWLPWKSVVQQNKAVATISLIDTLIAFLFSHGPASWARWELMIASWKRFLRRDMPRVVIFIKSQNQPEMSVSNRAIKASQKIKFDAIYVWPPLRKIFLYIIKRMIKIDAISFNDICVLCLFVSVNWQRKHTARSRLCGGSAWS